MAVLIDVLTEVQLQKRQILDIYERAAEMDVDYIKLATKERLAQSFMRLKGGR
jgi:hypothetical protein